LHDQIKKDEVGGLCSTHEREGKCKGKPGKMLPLGGPNWEDYIEIDLKETGYKDSSEVYDFLGCNSV
jgi:hypothetical protein